MSYGGKRPYEDGGVDDGNAGIGIVHRKRGDSRLPARIAKHPKKPKCWLSSVARMSVQMGAFMHPFLKTVSVLALGLSIAGCVTTRPPYPNVVPIDTTGNFGAR